VKVLKLRTHGSRTQRLGPAEKQGRGGIKTWLLLLPGNFALGLQTLVALLNKHLVREIILVDVGNILHRLTADLIRHNELHVVEPEISSCSSSSSSSASALDDENEDNGDSNGPRNIKGEALR
jgi:hypothetical protein